MRTVHSNPNAELFEHIIEEPSLTVTHIVLKAGESMPEHPAPSDAVAVPIKGQIQFADKDGENPEIIEPGIVVRMMPGDLHNITARTDAEMIVVKSKLA